MGRWRCRLGFDYTSLDDYWSSFSAGPSRIANASKGSRPNCAREIERHIRSGYLAGIPDGPRSFAIIVRAVRGSVP
jgi:hypothetical protein